VSPDDDLIMVSRSARPDADCGRGEDVALGLTDPLTALSFSAMPVAELAENHRALLAALREVDHWRRLIAARIDLAVASVADLEDLLVPPNAASYGSTCTPPSGLRDLLGIARLDQRLGETTLLMQLRRALVELAEYAATLEAVTDEAANMLAFRLGMVA
jgi:uncharacterized protein YjiS (DUF1127 family)